jgi:hypothetical protein
MFAIGIDSAGHYQQARPQNHKQKTAVAGGKSSHPIRHEPDG